MARIESKLARGKYFTRWKADVNMEFPERRTTSVLLTILVFAVVCALAYTARQVLLLFVLSVFLLIW